MNKKFYITTPIYYVNAEPHLGHAYSTILADFMNRFYKLMGYDSFFLTGTDEHGDKIAESAQEKGVSPKEYVDQISAKFKKAWSDLKIDYRAFVRTTDQSHKEVVSLFLQKIYETGDIYFGSYGGYYCIGCERFLTSKEIVNNQCPEHQKPVKFIEEKNYFFKLNKYQSWLIDYIEKNSDFIRPERYKNEVLSILKSDQLDDLCISRPKSRLEWGITLPFDDQYVTYVWFDALLNYISALGYPDQKNFKDYWPEAHHIIAKDILKPHGIFWPIMLKAAGLEPYQHLNVHGYWNMDDTKMSKSLGNVISPQSLIERYGQDQIRYFFLKEMHFGSDAKFSEEAIIGKVNFDLANDFGNLVKRTFNMTEKYFAGKIPEFFSDCSMNRAVLLDKIKNTSQQYFDFCKDFKTSLGLDKLWEFIRYLNKYIDEQKPWQLAKEAKTRELSSVLRNILESIYLVCFLLTPLLLETAPLVLKALKKDNSNLGNNQLEDILNFNNLKTKEVLDKIGVLFPKLEQVKD